MIENDPTEAALSLIAFEAERIAQRRAFEIWHVEAGLVPATENVCAT
jgi:hypothetical protein